MRAPNGDAPEPDETTSLLNKAATKGTDSSLSANGVSNGSSVAEEGTDVENGIVESRTADGDGDGDGGEAGERTRTRMGLLIPAVAIGVSFLL